MIFNYERCMGCKNKSFDIKVLLNNIFPAGICDMICDYNLHCSKCKTLNYEENRMKDRYYRWKIGYKSKTTAHNQIEFFQKYMTTPIFLSPTNRVNTRVFKKEIDNVMNKDSVKEKFKNNKMFLQAVKSCKERMEENTSHYGILLRPWSF